MPVSLPSAAPADGSSSRHAELGVSQDVESLTRQIKQMKNEMIQYASLLDNPAWKQQQPDGGKAVSLKRLHVIP